MEWDLKSENSINDSVLQISLNENINIFDKEDEEKGVNIENFILQNRNANCLEFDSSDYLLYNTITLHEREDDKKSLLFQVKHPSTLKSNHNANSLCTNETIKDTSDNTKYSINENNIIFNDKVCFNFPSFQIPNFSNLSYIEKIRKKKEMQKLKVLLEKKTKRNYGSSIYNDFTLRNAELSDKNDDKTFKNNKRLMDEIKLEIKKLRNRVSAQVSRDRKKKESIELKNLNHNLIEEKNRLEQELMKKEKEIESFRKSFKLLCPQCKDFFNKRKDESIIKYNNNNNTDKRICNFKKNSIISGMFTFAILCLFGSMLIGDTPITSNSLTQQRILKDNNISSKNNSESNDNSTQGDNNENNTYNSINSGHFEEDLLSPKALKLYLNQKYTFDENVTIKKSQSPPFYEIKNIQEYSPHKKMILEKENTPLVIDSISEKESIFLCEKVPKKIVNEQGSKFFNNLLIKTHPTKT